MYRQRYAVLTCFAILFNTLHFTLTSPYCRFSNHVGSGNRRTTASSGKWDNFMFDPKTSLSAPFGLAPGAKVYLKSLLCRTSECSLRIWLAHWNTHTHTYIQAFSTWQEAGGADTKGFGPECDAGEGEQVTLEFRMREGSSRRTNFKYPRDMLMNFWSLIRFYGITYLDGIETIG